MNSTYQVICAGLGCQETLTIDKDTLGWEAIFCSKCIAESSEKYTPPVCECGAEKIKYPWHSYWCPCYKDPMESKEKK